MRAPVAGLLLALLAVVSLAPEAGAKKFRYASGPKPPADSTLAVATPYLEPVVRRVGPKVPYTNLQLAAFVADTAVAHALGHAPLEGTSRLVLVPAKDHALNFVLEHALLNELTRRGIAVSVRHGVVPDDSVSMLFGKAGDPVLEYTLGSARTTYLRLVGWLPGRVKVERQSLVQGTLTLRDPATLRVLWSGDVGHNFIDRVNKGQLGIVEDAHYPDLHDDAPSRNIDKLVEPVVVVGIVGGLIALFFQNRPS